MSEERQAIITGAIAAACMVLTAILIIILP